MEQRIRLAQHGKHLWTRDNARKIRAAVEATLETLQPGDVLIIDTKGVEVFDYSFANELFGRTILIASKEYPGRFVLVENLTTYTRENLVKALEGMNLAMIERKGKSLNLIGKVHPTDAATFKAISRLGQPTTAAVLSKKLKVGLNAMNERLTKLAALGVVRRERGTSSAGREQFEYTAPA